MPWLPAVADPGLLDLRHEQTMRDRTTDRAPVVPAVPEAIGDMRPLRAGQTNPIRHPRRALLPELHRLGLPRLPGLRYRSAPGSVPGLLSRVAATGADQWPNGATHPALHPLKKA
ncbi:MAG: hypothetical protein ACRDRB_25745 [Pseudonocardiaceae bacterium]